MFVVASAGDAAAAEKLFTQARALIDQGRWAEACPKLEESNRLDEAVGTLLNLAACYEHVGKTASAWATYTRVAAMPTSGVRASFARAHAAALEPQLPKLTIRAPAGATVRRDGAAVASATFDVPIPVDPGRHVVDASLGSQRFHREIVAAPGATTVVIVSFAP